MADKQLMREELKTFFDIAWHSKHMFCMYCKLYEHDETRINLLKSVSSEFFGDLQSMWHEQILLDICKLMDPCRGKNLTVDYFLCKLSNQFTGEETVRIEKFVKDADPLLNKARQPRNKFIAHIDKEKTMAGRPLGGLSNNEIEAGMQMCKMINDFYDNFQDILNVISSKINGSTPEEYLMPLDPTGVVAEEFISFLEKSKSLVRSIS